jgi:hypothetical protein
VRAAPPRCTSRRAAMRSWTRAGALDAAAERCARRRGCCFAGRHAGRGRSGLLRALCAPRHRAARRDGLS